MPPRKTQTRTPSTPGTASPRPVAMAAKHNLVSVDISRYLDKTGEARGARGSDQTSQSEEGFYISEGNLKSIIADVMETAISKFMELVKTEMKAVTNEACEKIEAQIHDLNVKVDAQAQSLQALQTRVNNNEQNSLTAITKARGQDGDILKLQNALNETEQYTRRTHIRLHGLPDIDNETPQKLHETVFDMINDGYKVPLKEDDIEVCHRVGRSISGKPRQVLVRFLRRNTKDRLFEKLKAAGRRPGVQIYHDLTYVNSKLLYSTKHHPRIETAWATYTGHIMAKGVNGAVFRVDLLTDIDIELAKYNK